MHIINNSQRRAFIEVIQAASEMLDVMDAAPDNEFDAEWREAVRESVDRVSWLVNSHNIYINKNGN